MRRHHLLDRHQIHIAVAGGAGNDERMRRRAECRVRSVELQPSGTAKNAEIADPVAFSDSGEDESRARVGARCGALIPVTGIKPLRHKSNANQTLRRTAIAAPEATEFAIELVVALAGRHLEA